MNFPSGRWGCRGEEGLRSVLWIGENRGIRGEDGKESLGRRRNRTDGGSFEKERQGKLYTGNFHLTGFALKAFGPFPRAY